MSVDLKSMVRTINNQNLIVSQRYERWLLTGKNLPVPPHIAQRMAELMSTPPRDRSASFSASSAGVCQRAQVYGFLNAPVSDFTGSRLMAIYNNGTWIHMKLQVAFLMAGIIEDVKHIEFPVRWPAMNTRGTMDGIGYVPDDHPHVSWRGKEFGLEIKSANSNVYRMLKENGPDKYARQYTRYFNLSGVELFVVFVENKDTNEYMEWVIEPDPKMVKDDLDELGELSAALESRRLPDRIAPCKHLKGDTFRNCSFGRAGGTCATLLTFRNAAKAGEKNRGGAR